MADERELTHLNEAGEVRMVDVGNKAVTDREAVAEGLVAMSPDLTERFFAPLITLRFIVATGAIDVTESTSRVSASIS